MFGPIEGRQPNAYLYRASKLEEALKDGLKIDGIQHCIYDDQAYVLRPWMQTADPSLAATQEQLQFNASMNAARTAVEWSYKDIKQEFASNDFHRKLQVRKMPVANLYTASVLLRNFKTCLGHGAQPTGTLYASHQH